MLFTALNHWIMSGASAPAERNFNHIRITNIIALMVALLLLLQLPVLLLSYSADSELLSLNTAIHCLLLLLVPVCNQRGWWRTSRSLLVWLFASYLLLSCWLWQQNMHSHYFMLLGVFVCVFIYPRDEKRDLLRSLAFFCCAFLLLEWHYLHSGPVLADIHKYVRMRNALLLICGCLICAWTIRSTNLQSWSRLLRHHQRNLSLLDNLLPTALQEKLRRKDKVLTERLPCVTVLFADMHEYSVWATNRPVSEMVNILNEIYSAFDQLSQRYGLQRIKTNGDQYMAVAGVGSHQGAHARLSCACALQMMLRFNALCRRYQIPSGLRIGIASGEAIAGAIGQQALQFDIWGPAVILAARLEQQGAVNRIQVSALTARLAAKQFTFSKPHDTPLKGIGNSLTCWLTGKKNHVYPDLIRSTAVSNPVLAEKAPGAEGTAG